MAENQALAGPSYYSMLEHLLPATVYEVAQYLTSRHVLPVWSSPSSQVLTKALFGWQAHSCFSLLGSDVQFEALGGHHCL